MPLFVGLIAFAAIFLLVGWIAAGAWVWDELYWGGVRRKAVVKLLSPFIFVLAPVLWLLMTVPPLLKDALFGGKK